MHIYSYNEYLKLALNICLNNNMASVLKNENTLVLDMTSRFNFLQIQWEIYDKIIILTDDITDINLFNNARISVPLHYVQLKSGVETLVKALSAALGGPAGQHSKEMFAFRKELLSKRQHTVLSLTAKGLSLRQISLVLGLPSKIVSGYRVSALKRINKKLNVLTIIKLRVLSINQAMEKSHCNCEG